MSQPDYFAILDDCLARLRQGEAPEACLADHPEKAAELGPALSLSAELFNLPSLEPAPEAVAHGFEAMMGAADVRERPSWLAGVGSLAGRLMASLGLGQTGRISFALRVAVLTLLVVFASAAFVITASAGSLPGDRLYPVKRSWENARLALTLAEPARQALESDFAQQRREEVRAVLELRRPVTVEFLGRLQSTGDEVWEVDGLSVAVREDTIISGLIVVGQEIFVRAQAQLDGVLLALEIVGEEGGPPASDGPRGEPRPTDRPELGSGPPPSREPEPTREATPTPEATDRPTRRSTPEPTATRKPSDEPTATRETNDAPSVAGTATHEPRPTATPHDTAANLTRPSDDTKATPEPTATHRPTHEPTTTTDKPTPEPTAPHEPRPTETKPSDSAGGGSDRPG